MHLDFCAVDLDDAVVEAPFVPHLFAALFSTLRSPVAKKRISGAYSRFLPGKKDDIAWSCRCTVQANRRDICSKKKWDRAPT